MIYFKEDESERQHLQQAELQAAEKRAIEHIEQAFATFRSVLKQMEQDDTMSFSKRLARAREGGQN